MGNALRSPLRPLYADEFVDNGDGSRSTERTVTVMTPEGWVVVPSLWMSPNGPVDLRPLGDDYISAIALGFEQSNGTAFPRFGTNALADAWAANRSESGGTGVGPLQRRNRPR